MSPEQVLGVLWRRRWMFLVTTALCAAAVVAVTLALPKRYDATATLFVGERPTQGDALALDTGVGEQLARTYTTLAAQPSVADVVLSKMPRAGSRDVLLQRMTFAPVERTQLLQITARDDSPERARDLANLYAETFVARVADNFKRSAAPTQISLTEPAVAPVEAALPNVPLYLGFGAVLALLLSAGTVLLRDRLDDRLRVELGDQEVLGQPIVARIPDFGGRRAPGPAVDDAFRLLRANADFSSELRPRVIGVTSAMPLDGKSTVAARLAIAAAQAGESVVLVEADLRRPGLRHTVAGEGTEPHETGLTNYLAGTAGLDEVIQPHPSHAGLSVVWPGPLPPNPTRLLGNARLQHLLAELRGHFDRVVLDTSPISVGADASAVLPRADAVLFVVDGQRTGRSAAQAGLAQLETSRAVIAGVVVNRDGRPPRDTYGYHAIPVPEAELEGAGGRDPRGR